MIIDRIEISNLRVFQNREFRDLSRRMNVFIGENGVGKSTVLDGLRYNLSRIIPRVTEANGGYINADKKDIRFGKDKLSVELDLRAKHVEFTHKVSYNGEHWARSWNPSDSLVKDSIQRDIEGSHSEPLAIHFSPRRSIPRGTDRSKGAHQAALALRGLNVKSFIDWWHFRDQYAKKGHKPSRKYIHELRNAVSRFLEGRYELEGITEDQSSILLRKEGSPLTLSQLSDGERGVLALVLDITKRLTQANPELESPTHEAEAVILIDELALHIHPRWQRYIVERLKGTFKKCQFICTTHSPQIIGELEPDEVFVISKEGVKNPSQAFGMDTNWILESVMGAPKRNVDTEKRLRKLIQLAQSGEISDAQKLLKNLKDDLHGENREIERAEALMERIQLLGNEED